MHDPVEIEINGYVVYLDVDEAGNLQVRVYRAGEYVPAGVFNVL